MKRKHCWLLMGMATVLNSATAHADAVVFAQKESVTERTTRVVFLTRDGDTNMAFSVDYSTRDETAKAWEDYVPLRGTLAFAAGERRKPLFLTALADGAVDRPGIKTLSLLLTNATAGVRILGAETQLSVVDNEMPANLDVAFNPVVGGGPFVVQPDGKILLAGHRLNPDGSLDETFRPAAVPNLSTIALVPDGKIFISGTSIVNHQPRAVVARLRPDGSPDPDFVPPVSFGTNVDYVTILLVQRDGKPILELRSVSDELRRLVRLQTSGALDDSFHPVQITEGWISSAVEDSSGRILIGGGLIEIDGTPRPSLLRLQTDGSVDQTFHAAPEGTVSAIIVQEGLGIVVVSGDFNPATSPLARFQFDGSMDSKFEAPIGYYPFAIIPVESNKLIAVGRQWPGDEACITILKLGTNGAAEQEIGEARTDGQGDFTYPRSAALHQGRLLISAGFTSTFNGVPRPGLARFLLEDIPESSIAVGLVRPPWNSKAGQWDLPSEGPVVRSGFGPLFANEGGVSFKVRRLGNSIEPVQVAYASVEGTARAGEDYIARAGALSFAPLEVEKTVTIATINDGIREPEETFALSLTAVTGGEQVGGPASVILLDDDGDAALAVDADKLSVDGIVELTLRAPWYSRWSVESSADLSSWTRLTEVSGSPFGSFIDDSEAGRFPIRFYRAVRMQP